MTFGARLLVAALAVFAFPAQSSPQQGANLVSPDAKPDSSTTVSARGLDDPNAGAITAAVVARDELPNARIRLRLHFHAPSLPERTITQTLWLHGTRFHVRDEAGRALNDILGDVTAPRGLGRPATTLEEIMDRREAARKQAPGVTDVFGDLATGAGVVARWSDQPWARSARELLPIVQQVLSGDRTEGLARAGKVTRLGRKATAYKGVVAHEHNGHTSKTNIVRVVAPPYLLLDEARDAELKDYYYVREVLSLDVGVVTEADLTPPTL